MILRTLSYIWKTMLRSKYTDALWNFLVRAGLVALPKPRILLQNDHFVVIDKDPDVRINSDDPNMAVTVENQLRLLYPDKADARIKHGYRFIHRLDFATSGVLCLAFNKKACNEASQQFKNTKVTKHYLALVRGHIQIPYLTINLAIGKETAPSMEHMCCASTSATCINPKQAKTHLVLLELGLYQNSPASKVLLIPETGRQHQLRVHCMSVGHPIVGDYTYSFRTDNKPYRMMLHAYRLIIPLQSGDIDVTAPDPFLTETDGHWRSTDILLTYSDFIKT
ncbi:RNA pseudouridylate synthase domain-containing protein 1 [Lingula anatina]|uniref:RNA pseudouridylate synthase domain-containing protein 1 n=1 Tax=Lingula anatina TaxID=7574 RepID=A0A1S3IXX3_LINAN|nr:RNA pseudouridylate synthase domain-containing protein 1 [Lingula anatina]|eukprot:XP_013402831.1 RNA pseudouridylate synthase domain-containing protein 1 [Lingula anatina]